MKITATILFALALAGSLAMYSGCGTTLGISGNPTNVTAGADIPIGDNTIVTVSGTINPTNPSDWTAGISVTLRNAIDTLPAETLAKIASAGGQVAIGNRTKVFIPNPPAGYAKGVSLPFTAAIATLANAGGAFAPIP